MRFVKISKEDIKEVGLFYRSVMSDAYEGLFFWAGKKIGKDMVDMISDENDFMERGAKLIEGRGWVDEIWLERDEAIARGSIEAHEEWEEPSCHILRGIICGLYEEGTGKMIEVEETKCVAVGDEHCEFKIETKAF